MSYLVTVIILLYLFKNFKRATLLLCVCTPMLRVWAPMGKVPIVAASGCFVVGLYILFHSKRIKEIKNNPLLAGGFIMIVSLLISNVFAEVKHTPSTIAAVVDVIVFFIAYQIIQNLNVKDEKWILRVICLSAIIIMVNGFIETFGGKNILFDFFIDSGAYEKDTTVVTGIRFGLKRCQSVFSMHTSCAGFSFVVFNFLFYLWKHSKIGNISLLLISLGLCILLFITGVRSGIVGFTISLLCYVDKSLLRGGWIFFLLILVIILSLALYDYLAEIIESVVNTESVGGSNKKMREGQLEISYSQMLKSPLIGNGPGFTLVTIENDSDLFGAESLWFPVMIEQGILGLIAYITIFYQMIRFAVKKEMKKYIFVILGFVVFNTMSNVPYTTWSVVAFYMVLVQKMCSRTPQKHWV